MRLLFLLAVANLLGVGIGILFYYPQLEKLNPVFWIFIPDCPVYVLLATLFYFKILKNDVLYAIAGIGLLKYGLWTLLALFYFSDYFLSNAIGWLLVIEHMGMSLQYVFFVRGFCRKTLLIALAWFLLNDIVDYGFGMHPFLPSPEFGIILIFSFLSSFIIPIFTYFAGNRIKENKIVKNITRLILEQN